MRVIGVIFVLIGFVAHALAGERMAWPSWRGPERDGSAVAFSSPETWPDRLSRRWERVVGLGHSGPVVGDERLYIHTREGPNEVVRCIRLDSGKEVWRKEYRARYKINPAAKKHGKGPKSTPALTEGHLVTFGINGTLSCWRPSSGEVRWQKTFRDEFAETQPSFGTAMSPLIDRGRCIAHVGGGEGGALRAFDLDSGRVIWSWEGDGPGYASPIIVEIDGTRQIVTQSRRYCIGVAVDSGRLLWKIPFTTPYRQNIVTPVKHGNVLIFSGHQQGIFAYRLENKEGNWTPRKVWEGARPSMYMSSPVLVNDLLFGFAEQHRGQFFCMDVKSSQVGWRSSARMGNNALLFKTDSKIVSLTSEGELFVIDANGRRFDVTARYTVAETPTWSQPAFVDDTVLIKAKKKLIAWTTQP